MSSLITSRRVGSSVLAAGELGPSAPPIYKTRFGYRVSIDAKLTAYSYPTLCNNCCKIGYPQISVSVYAPRGRVPPDL